MILLDVAVCMYFCVAVALLAKSVLNFNMITN